MKDKVTGSCLCGKVRFQITGPFQRFALCYCSRCRKATGSAHASNLFTEAGNVRWLAGESFIRRFELPGAERFAKCFCSECGSALPSVSRDGLRLLVPAGSLDDDPLVRPQLQIFCADRAPWYDSIEDAQRFDGAPL